MKSELIGVGKWIKRNWQATPSPIPLFAVLILLAVALLLNLSNFLNLAWFALVALTAMYAYATLMVVQESKRMRLDTVKPSLSLQPEDFLLGGGFASLYLMNSGGVAKDVKIDIEVTTPLLNKALFISTINREHKVYLDIGVSTIQNAGGVVKVGVNFMDSYNQSHSESLSIDFSELKKEGREIRGQHSELDEIQRVLERIERKIK